MSFGSFDPQHEDNMMAEINVTPLVDVMLVLLIVFMITMPIITYTIPLKLPTTSLEEENDDVKQPLTITIDKDGDYYLNSTKITLDEFSKLIVKRQATAKEDLVLAISADELVEYKYVVEVLEMAKKFGVSKIGFVTEVDVES